MIFPIGLQGIERVVVRIGVAVEISAGQKRLLKERGFDGKLQPILRIDHAIKPLHLVDLVGGKWIERADISAVVIVEPDVVAPIAPLIDVDAFRGNLEERRIATVTAFGL